MKVLVDTGAWYALADESDDRHEPAREFYIDALPRLEFVTTVPIMVETWALLDARLGRHAAIDFWAAVREARFPTLSVEEVDLESAWRIVEAWPDQSFSLTHSTSFAMMERLGIEQCFAFDDHFLVYRYGPRRDRSFQRLPY